MLGGAGRPVTVTPQRAFTAVQRRIVEIRDNQRCFEPTCEAKPPRLQIDHVVPASAGGPTSIDNGRLACGHHNRAAYTA